MYKVIVMCFKMIVRLLAFLLVGSVLLVVRYVFRTPQSLKSVLPGEAHLYKWTYGQIYYQIVGPQDAPPLVLVHAPGIGTSSYEMRDIMHILAQHYRVYALDLLGFGLSDAPTIDYTASTYVTLLSDFLATVVERPATLLASGLSCHYCAAVAATRSDLCAGLVLLSPPSLSTQQYQAKVIAFLAGLPFFGLALYSLLSLRFLLPQANSEQKDMKEQSRDYRFAVAHQLNAHHAGLAFLAGKLAMANNAPCFAAIQQPVLELWGTRRLQEMQAYVLQEFATPHSQVVLLRDVGPHVLEEQPQAVMTHILTWERQLHAAERQTEPRVVEDAPECLAAKQGSMEDDTNNTGEGDKRENTQEAGNATEIVFEAYCVKCRQKRTMENPKETVTKNGRSALEGNCPICGTRLFRFISRQ